MCRSEVPWSLLFTDGNLQNWTHKWYRHNIQLLIIEYHHVSGTGEPRHNIPLLFPAPISGNLYSNRVPHQEPRRAPFTPVKIRLADDSSVCVTGLPPLPGFITCLGDVTRSSDTYASEL
jgi:hypothetical protein